jgi:elongation factor G
MSFTTELIRNIAVAGHGSTGKTSLVEHILFSGGAISKPEMVEAGKTVSDYTEEEIDRKISIRTTASYVEWNKTKINILDTPGAPDFIGEVISAYRAAESTLLLVGAKDGVQIETIKLWRRLEKRNMPRAIFINKMETERAEFLSALDDLREKFGATFIPVTFPMGNGLNFKGIVDTLGQKAYMAQDGAAKESTSDIPDDVKDEYEEYRNALIEAAAEGDDDLLEKFFEAGTLDDAELKMGLAKGWLENKFVPVFCGSALLNSGITSLLNFIADVGPSPATTIETIVKNEEEEEVTLSGEGSFSGFCFKTNIDQFSGRLSYIKVVTGKLSHDTDLYNPRGGKKEKLSKIYITLGKKLIEVQELAAGDMGVLTKIASADTNDTFCTSGNDFTYKPLRLPQPVHALSISAVTKKDEDKLSHHLQRAAEEDKTFQINYNTETKETVISGMGEMHINMILDKIKDQQKIEVETRVPRVAYRETITKSADATYRHKKQTGGHGQFGEVAIKVHPLPRGEYYKFENSIRGMAVSKGYIPGIEKGLHEAMEGGILAGYPVVDVAIALTDGKEHPVDSSEMAFKLAARGALRESFKKAGAVLLEPVMNLSVFVDDEYMGDVLSDLSSRRGRVLGQEPIGGGIQEIKAQVPQAELLRYSIDLRSFTSGTASFEIEFDHYNPISGKIADDVIKATQTAKEAD